MELAKSFEPHAIEAKWYPLWESRGYFKPSYAPGAAPYCIQLPPPNVTGTLHMGHAFQQTLMDVLIRYHRMRGYNTLWQVGTDHAGIATQIVVEQQLKAAGQTRHDLGREAFNERVWQWKEASGSTITHQMRRLGAAADWSRERFTMDEGLSAAVRETFVRLHDDGLIYRGKRLVNWDPKLMTAVSDLEVDNDEEQGRIWEIAYPLADGSASLVVATTRPETMLGDTAVAVHPDDERYRAFIGKHVRLPLTGRDIPIIADDYVDREFGTGVVKITPAHDFNDWAVGQRHQLPALSIFNLDATINDNAPAPYRGLDRYAARKAVIADLASAGLVVAEKAHRMIVPRCGRTGEIVEPMLTDQWYVAMRTPAPASHPLWPGRTIQQLCLDAVSDGGIVDPQTGEAGRVRFVPGEWISTYLHWINNIQDWCISRQLWWGHQIPAWYDESGNVYVARTEADALAQATRALGRAPAAFRRDDDVLDTWFSSALWCHSTLGWPADTRELRTFLPSSTLVTGFDIIFFWVARMIMMTDRLVGEIPFQDVYITGLVRDKDGQKMSKSKGNILDPLDLIDGISLDDLVAKRTSGLMQPKMAEKIEKATRREFPDGIPAFGADALRFTMAALAGHGRDIKFDLGRAEGYKNFCNKLWNATRFVLMNTEGAHFSGAPIASSDAERWIMGRLASVSAQAAQHFADYRFDLLSQALYEFAWSDFCDWFVELAKPALNGDDDAAADSMRHTLLFVLERLLSLLHPLIPFVTEALWQSVAPRLAIGESTIMLRPYPLAADFADVDAAVDTDIAWLQAMVTALRRVRSELNVAPAKQIALLLAGGTADERARVTRFTASLRFLVRLERIDAILAADQAPAAATAVVGDMTLLVPLEGLVDLSAERARLDKELKRVDGEIAKSRGKLSSDTFVQNAPAAVVEQERQRLLDWTAQQQALSEQRAKL